jgi:two-component system, OmpR family, sensor kinase
MKWRPARLSSLPSDADRRLVARATRTMAVLTAGAVCVVVAAVVLLSVVLTVRDQRLDAQRIVRDAATTAEDVADPPHSVILLWHRQGERGNEASPGTPPAVAAIDVAGLPSGASQVAVGGNSYRLYAVDRDRVRVVAAVNARYRSSETRRLLSALLPAGLAGVVASSFVGWLVARRSVRPLAASLAIQRRFVADASHELRTPLTILYTRAQLLRRRAGDDPELRRNLDRLTADTRALTEIVNDLLVSAELQHRPAMREPVDVAALAGDVVDSFEPIADRADVDLVATITDDADMTVAGVRSALRRALSALVDNALGHTPAGGTVEVAVSRREDTIQLNVIDNGEGIDSGQVDALTKRFARGPGAPGQGRRFGLGLALVREVVDAHAGSLVITGQPGQGTTASITLPAATMPAAIIPEATMPDANDRNTPKESR